MRAQPIQTSHNFKYKHNPAAAESMMQNEIKAVMAGGKQGFDRPSDRDTERQTSKQTAKPTGRHKGRAQGGAK